MSEGESKHTVAVLPSQTTAEVVRQQLKAAGIEAEAVEVDSSFRLQVAEADFERAMQTLFPVPQAAGQAAGGAAWFCSQCGEEVQPQSEVCWSCGKPRARPSEAAQTTKPVKVINPNSSLLRSSPAPAKSGQADPLADAEAQAATPPEKAGPRRVERASPGNWTFLAVVIGLIVLAVAFIAWRALR